MNQFLMLERAEATAMSAEEHPDDMLEAGLRAAFAPPESQLNDPGADDIFATLGETLGPSSRILLRDLNDEPTPFVKPCDDRAASVLQHGRRYQVMGEIARGGVGVVFKTRDVNLGRDIAMKVLRDDHADNPAMVRRFVEEAQISGQLQHPGILPVYELGLHDESTPYFTMRLVKGQTLAALLHHRSDRAADRQRFLTIFQHVCQTVAFAHAKGVIHRDLKPSNVMVGAFGEVQVVDWGLAKVLRQGGLVDDRRADDTAIETVRTNADGSASLAGSVMGTPAYMPPEQARGDVAAVDERTDVFALGAILCEILTGQPPFLGEKMEILRSAVAGNIGGAEARLDDCGADEDLIAIAKNCLAVSPAARPRDAGVLADAVTTYLESLESRARALEVQAAEAAARADAERRARRLTLTMAALALTLVAVIGAGLFWWQQQRRDRLREKTELVNASLNRTAMLLGQAKETPIGQMARWEEAMASGEQLQSLISSHDAEDATLDRAGKLLADLKRAETDRRMIERIEDVVIVGATHDDRQSWEWMEAELRRAFADYGVELGAHPPADAAARIRACGLAPQLADGLELWVATCFDVNQKGGKTYAMKDLLTWLPVLHEADPDPFRTALRKLIWTGKPDLAKLRELADGVDLATVMPRTLSWLAMGFAMAGGPKGAIDLYHRAALIHPGDFMLNFDFAYLLGPAGRWQEAIRYYYRALAIRPNVGGVWRCLGVALRHTNEVPESADALRQSINVQPGHAPTYIDLGLTLFEMKDSGGAIEAYREAIRLKPDMPAAYGYLGHALQKQGALTEALEAFRKCHELGSGDKTWKEPSAQWIAECEAALRREQADKKK